MIQVIRNTDSFGLAIRRFRPVGGGEWWLINLCFATILINHPRMDD